MPPSLLVPTSNVQRLAQQPMPQLTSHFRCVVAAVSLAAWPALAQSQHVGSAASESAAGRDAAAIEATLDTMAAGWNRGDLGVYLSGYSDSIMTRGADGFVVGRPAVEKVMRDGYWKSGRPVQALHIEHLEVRRLSSDVAIATGEFVLSGGGQPTHTGWFTTVWKRTAAGWRCVHDHSS